MNALARIELENLRSAVEENIRDFNSDVRQFNEDLARRNELVASGKLSGLALCYYDDDLDDDKRRLAEFRTVIENQQARIAELTARVA